MFSVAWTAPPVSSASLFSSASPAVVGPSSVLSTSRQPVFLKCSTISTCLQMATAYTREMSLGWSPSSLLSVLTVPATTTPLTTVGLYFSLVTESQRIRKVPFQIGRLIEEEKWVGILFGPRGFYAGLKNILMVDSEKFNENTYCQL